jgi:membrane associated rhomboid family serine protease
MLVLFSFGQGIENIFLELKYQGIIRYPKLMYGLLYLSSIIIASLLSLKKNKHNEWYNSVGASGAISAIVFAHLFFAPWQRVYFYAFLPIPGIIFGLLYLIYSQYMSRHGSDNINHDAHFLGAVYGFLFPLLLEPKLIYYFINQLTQVSW